MPEVTFGHTSVFLRADGRFGPNDATQRDSALASEKYPHLIRYPLASPIDVSTDLSVMWWSPSISSWKQSKTTGVIGVGDLSGPEINALVALKDQLKADALRLLESQGETLAITHSCFTAMIHSWVRFHGYPSTFDEKTLELVEFQRNWLELRGCVDYYDDTVRKMWSRLAPEGVVLERVGCLTVNPIIAQESALLLPSLCG